MKQELEDKIYNSFPVLFPNNLAYGNSLAYGIECEDGWFELIFNLCKQLVDEKIEVTQIKEKFGTLRFYYNSGNDKVKDLVRLAEIKSSSICEFCGTEENVKLYSAGWNKTLCVSHAHQFYKVNYACLNCNFKFDYEADFKPFQCPKCRSEDLKELFQ